MRQHHQNAINNLIAKYRENKNYIALILVGSIAKGRERDDSDIDIVLVATDEEFERIRIAKAYQFHDKDMCNYEGGYFDVKIVNLNFLIEASESGNEITRASFIGAKVLYSDICGLQNILDRVSIYQSHEQFDKIQSFYSQFLASHWWAIEALCNNNRFLLCNAISDLIFWGSRIILAHNKVLFPSHKELLSEVEKAQNKPNNILQVTNEVLIDTNKESINLYYNTILNYKDWDIKPELSIGWYVENNAWSWFTGVSNIYYL